MRIILPNGYKTDVFDTLDIIDAKVLVKEKGGTIYSWKAVGQSNWLEKGVHWVDVLALAILPTGLPDYIEMPNDLIELGDDLGLEDNED